MTYLTVANSTGWTLTTGLDATARPVSMRDNQIHKDYLCDIQPGLLNRPTSQAAQLTPARWATPGGGRHTSTVGQAASLAGNLLGEETQIGSGVPKEGYLTSRHLSRMLYTSVPMPRSYLAPVIVTPPNSP